jgi:hypothetical protein
MNKTGEKALFKIYFKKIETGEIVFSHDFIDVTGKNNVEIVIQPKSVMPGSYSTNIWLGKETGDCYDLIDEVYELQVNSKAYFRDLGFDPTNPGYYTHVPIAYVVR